MEVFRLIMLRSVDGLFGGETALWRDFKRASERKTRERTLSGEKGRERKGDRDREKERERGRK